MFKRLLIAALKRIIPNFNFKDLPFGTGGAFQYFTVTSDRASASVHPHELGHCIQQWICSLLVGVSCYLYGMDPLLVLGCALVFGFPLWAVLYGVDILCRTLENKYDRVWGWKLCLYVAYKNALFERHSRAFADQAEENWIAMYHRKYGA